MIEFVELNKLTQNKRVILARNKMYGNDNLTHEDVVVLMSYACKKMYGLGNTARLLHALGIEKIKSQL